MLASGVVSDACGRAPTYLEWDWSLTESLSGPWGGGGGGGILGGCNKFFC